MWLETGWKLQQTIYDDLFEYSHVFVLEQAILDAP